MLPRQSPPLPLPFAPSRELHLSAPVTVRAPPLARTALAREIAWLEPPAAFEAVRVPALAGTPGQRAGGPAAGALELRRRRPVPSADQQGRAHHAGRAQLHGRSLGGAAACAGPLPARPRPGLADAVPDRRGRLVRLRSRAPPRAPAAPGPDDLAFPDLALGFYDACWPSIFWSGAPGSCPAGWPEGDARGRACTAAGRVRTSWRRCWATPPPRRRRSPTAPVEPRSNFTRAGYEAAVRRVVDYILAGDIFQANLSQRFLAELPDGLGRVAPVPAPARAATRRRSRPTWSWARSTLASASPERFLQLRGRQVETRPIKGTRPRGATPADGCAARATSCSPARRTGPRT